MLSWIFIYYCIIVFIFIVCIVYFSHYFIVLYCIYISIIKLYIIILCSGLLRFLLVSSVAVVETLHDNSEVECQGDEGCAKY